MKHIILSIALLVAVFYPSRADEYLYITKSNIGSFPEVSADVFIFGESGFPVEVSQSDFIVRDNGITVQTTSYINPPQNSYESISLTLLLDRSLDEQGAPSLMMIGKSLAKEMINLKNAKDEISVLSYDYINYLHSDRALDKTELISSLDFVTPSEAAFLDAGLINEPADAIRIAGTGTYPASIVLITDANPNAKYDEILLRAKEKNIKIFVAGVGVILDSELRSLAESTGGFWIDEIKMKDVPTAARAFYAFSMGFSPSTINWDSYFSCDDHHMVEVTVPAKQAKDKFEFERETSDKPFIISDPEFIGFSSVPINQKKKNDITIIAKNRDMLIHEFRMTDPHFTIIAGQMTDEVLKKDQPHVLTVEFTPTDSAIVFSKLIVDTEDACDGREIFFTGGYPNTPPNVKTIEITHPECKQTLLAGETIDVDWVGLLPKDVVQIFFSSDNGMTWDTLAKNTTGLSVQWQVPDIESDECLIRIIQLWPNNVGKTLDLHHNEEVNSAFFNEDGSMVVTASDDKTAIIWNASNGEIIHVLKGHSKQLYFAEFSPDSKYVVTAGADSLACLWSTETGEVVARYEGHTNNVSSAHISPDGTKVLTSSWDGTAKIWDLLSGTELQSIGANQNGASGRTWFANWEPNGKFIITCGNDQFVKMWNVESGLEVRRFDTQPGNSYGNVKHCIFNSTGTKVAAASEFDPKNVTVFDVVSEQALFSVHHNKDTSTNHVINSSSFFMHPTQGELLLTSGVDNVARLWSAVTGNPVDPKIFAEHSNSVKTAVFNFDASRVLTASWDSTAKIWNLRQNFLQIDTTDCAFRIANADADANDVDFGDVAIGRAKDSVITDFVFNIAGFDFEIESLKLTNEDGNDFKIINQAGYPYILESDGSLSLTIRFTPQAVGNRRARVNVNIPGKSFEFSVFGNGIERTLIAMPEFVDFGNVDIGNLRDMAFQDMILNSSNTDITLNDVQLLGRDKLVFGLISGLDEEQIAGGSSNTVAMRFSPQEEGNKHAYIQIDHSGFDSPLLINLFGTGIIPVTDSITISMPQISGAPGEIINIPVKVEHLSRNGIQETISGFSINLRYNNTLLLPKFNHETVNQQYSYTTIKFELPREFSQDSVLTVLSFRVGLGNDTTSVLELSETSPLGMGKILINEKSGKFKLEGYCDDGGLRLIDNSGTIRLSQNQPNPATNITRIEFEVIELGRTNLVIYNSEGRMEKIVIDETLSPGSYSIDVNTDMLTSGSYYYILQTPTQQIVKQMIISR